MKNTEEQIWAVKRAINAALPPDLPWKPVGMLAGADGIEIMH